MNTIVQAPQSVIPVFVVGYQHSGTTLLQNILRNSIQVFSIAGETKFFEFLPMIRNEYQDLDNNATFESYVNFLIHNIQKGYRLKNIPNSPGELESIQISDTEFASIYHYLRQFRDHVIAYNTAFSYLADVQGKSHYLEKTPTHIYHLDTIIGYIPSAKVIEIIRDPRDILASKKKRRQDIWTTNRYRPDQMPWKPYEKSYDPVWDTLSWKAAISAGRQAAKKYPGNIFTIRYEDLVSEPQNSLQKICKFVNLPFDPQMLIVNYRNAADIKSARSQQKQIATDAIGNYKKRLNSAEIKVCQDLTFEYLQLFRYSKAQVSVKVFAIGKIYLFSGAEFFQRLYGRFKLGGLPYVFNVLRNYFRRLKKLLTQT